jgi:transposase-like protein
MNRGEGSSKAIMVEVLGCYSNLGDQGERLRELLEMTPSEPPKPILRTNRQVQHRLRDTQPDQVVAGYQAGATVYELAKKFGIHRHTVSDILERHGVARRYRKLSAEQLALACALYENGSSLTQVGRQLDHSAETVRQALMKAGVAIRTRNGWS